MAYYTQGSNAYPMSNPHYTGTAEKYRMQQPADNMSGMQSQRGSSAPKWSWCSTIWSSIAVCLCTSWCSCIGLLCSIWAYVDHKSGDYSRSRRKNRWAWGCAITGILLFVLIIVGVVVVFVTMEDQVCKAYMERTSDWGIDLDSYCRSYVMSSVISS